MASGGGIAQEGAFNIKRWKELSDVSLYFESLCIASPFSTWCVRACGAAVYRMSTSSSFSILVNPRVWGFFPVAALNYTFKKNPLEREVRFVCGCSRSRDSLRAERGKV